MNCSSVNVRCKCIVHYCWDYILQGRHMWDLWKHFQIPVNEITQKLLGGLLLIFSLFIIYCITSIDSYLHNIDGCNCIGWWCTLFSVAARETDVLFEVLFDEEFLGGLTIRFVWRSSESIHAIGIDGMELLVLVWWSIFNASSWNFVSWQCWSVFISFVVFDSLWVVIIFCEACYIVEMLYRLFWCINFWLAESKYEPAE